MTDEGTSNKVTDVLMVPRSVSIIWRTPRKVGMPLSALTPAPGKNEDAVAGGNFEHGERLHRLPEVGSLGFP
jgi:hypothetical protein